MAKFKEGDKVGYNAWDSGELRGPLVVSTTKENGHVWFTEGTWLEEERLFLWSSVGENTNNSSTSWDYAEARRLQDAAKAAVEAYNEYIKRKPTDVFPEVWNPFQS